jgi:hypothetical protein
VIGRHELNRRFEVWRNTLTDDDLGGTTVTPQSRGEVVARIPQPAPVEQIQAQQASSSFSVTAYFLPGADVRRGDRLVAPDNGDSLRVKFTIVPSEPEYLRADCEQLQSEGDAP